MDLHFFQLQAITLNQNKSYPIFHFTEELKKTAVNCKWTIIGKPPAMLDCHVAEVYGKETHDFNQQVERNKEYFKEEWRFQPTLQEWNLLKSMVKKDLQEGATQSGTLSQVFGSKAISNTPPWFYTEKGVDMAAFFQKSPAAKQYAIFIVESFQQFKEQLRSVQNKAIFDTLLQAQKLALEMAKNFGLQGNQAILSASNAVFKLTGYNILEILDQKQLICEPQEVHLSSTAIGNMFKISAQKVNKSLEKAKLQESFRDAKNKKCWKPTEKGKSFSVLKDTNKKHKDGRPVQQLMWLESVIPILKGSDKQSEFTF